MRRSDRQLSREDAIEILEKGEYGSLSMVDAGGRPYAVPVNYCLVDDTVYFHCAAEGMKIDCLETNPAVAFCVVGTTELLPDKFGTLYESAIVRGKAFEAVDNRKRRALEALISKYSGDYLESGMNYIDKLYERTRVFGIVMDELTGKGRKS